MRKSKEELSRIHKAKCKELKKVCAKIAEDLGVEVKCCYYEKADGRGGCGGKCTTVKKDEYTQGEYSDV